ncbi:protein YIPF5 [Aethina tumida]|uniref:protein YIPF5 n=1 Tax=Aethina tumida TaxID=116153 RepID=UPI00096B2C44|nr:protein YIPF5 [Aethina tumida]XP_049820424.1 protein YIPF5 [Aethina tumida]
MGDYSVNQQDFYWGQQGDATGNGYYNQDYTQFENQQLDFKNVSEYENTAYASYAAPQMYTPTDFVDEKGGVDEFDEPPLLEELEIYPDRILEKVCAVLNPLRAHSLADDADYLTKEADLAGPIFFCLLLASCLFMSGSKVQFGYIYGISTTSCVLMYVLLNLMSHSSGTFSLSTVASILGYCLIPIVGLSIIGLFFKFSGLIGVVLSALVVIWSSFSASRLFTTVSGDKQQQPLIAYPCAIIYGVYILLVVF